MKSRREITERFGDPANFEYRGQFYHSTTAAKCALCGRDIRNVYTLQIPQGRSVPSGECCFPLFQKWNLKVYTRLVAAKVLLGAYDDGVRSDVTTYNATGDYAHYLREWRRLKRQVMKAIRDYNKATGTQWLPKPLYDLKAEADKTPGKTLRWFNSHFPVLKEKFAEADGFFR